MTSADWRDANKDDKRTFEAEIGTITERDSGCHIMLLQTAIECSVVNFPQLKNVTKYVSCQLGHRTLAKSNRRNNIKQQLHSFFTEDAEQMERN